MLERGREQREAGRRRKGGSRARRRSERRRGREKEECWSGVWGYEGAGIKK